ncbi:MAG: DUF1858 domain-containing protein [Clostridiales bacterium]|nr:DUF1858 domain-containing protein [Clostridiales bacterium]
MITKETTIIDILRVDERLADILVNAGMHCLGCAMAHHENLEQACAVHGIDADAIVAEMNEFLNN